MTARQKVRSDEAKAATIRKKIKELHKSVMGSSYLYVRADEVEHVFSEMLDKLTDIEVMLDETHGELDFTIGRIK